MEKKQKHPTELETSNKDTIDTTVMSNFQVDLTANASNTEATLILKPFHKKFRKFFKNLIHFVNCG